MREDWREYLPFWMGGKQNGDFWLTTVKSLYSVLPLLYLVLLTVNVFIWWDMQHHFDMVTATILKNQSDIMLTEKLVARSIQESGKNEVAIKATQELIRQALEGQEKSAKTQEKMLTNIAAAKAAASKVAADLSQKGKAETEEMKRYKQQQEDYQQILEQSKKPKEDK